MRGTFGDAFKRNHLSGTRYTFSEWWLDWPGRHWYTWRELLFDPGSGWLRWRGAYIPAWDYIDSYPYEAGGFTVYPPVRRAWLWLRQFPCAPFLMLRHRLSWVEVTFSWSDLPTDPDREALWR